MVEAVGSPVLRPGQDDHFTAVFSTLRRHRYDRVVAVEPFDYHPDGRVSTARAIGCVRGILEAVGPARG
ncbi:MAG: hypothetical protein ACRELA_07485 [Candidatus Rokuibacteriota bacterium]